jgi:outer membrane receptor for ferrienterochelin and colicin
MVMLDGKLMRMSMPQVLTLLNGISADDIEKIELLNTPPAKYDADGNAGLINIITKKNKQQGTNGSATVTAGIWPGRKGLEQISP